MDRYRPEIGEQPCLNCAGFHYGRCFHPPRQCWCCGDFGHIQRYCPRKPRQRRYEGGSLPGTRVWCEMHGLNGDRDLKWRVLDTLKILPGAAIFVDDACILQGKEVHLSRGRHQQPRDERPLADRMTRGRSRSPSRERMARKRERSRTPLVSYRRSRSRDSIDSMNAFRSRAHMARSSGSHAVIFEAAYNHLEERRSLNQQSNIQPSFSVSATRGVPQYENRTNQRTPASAERPIARRALADMNNMRVQPQYQNPSQRQGDWVEDPHFVLGVKNGATEAEVAEAYEQHIWQIDQERMGPAGEDDDRWNSSIRILEAARRQLIGY